MSDRMGPFDSDNADDEAARRLRDVLSAHAQGITPSADALTTIRQKIRAQERGHRSYAWRRVLQVGAAGLGTVAIAAVAVVVAVAVRHRPPTADHHIVAAASTPVTSNTPTPTPTPLVAPVAPVSSAPGTYAVSVYYVDKRKDPDQLLFREQTMAPTSPLHTFVKDAVTAMLSTPAHDPDYTSYWPAGTTVNAVNITGGTTAVVDLSAQAANGPAGKGAISAQQLLYTIIASAPKIDGLQLRINGTPVTSLWGSPLAATVAPEPSWQVLGSRVDHLATAGRNGGVVGDHQRRGERLRGDCYLSDPAQWWGFEARLDERDARSARPRHLERHGAGPRPRPLHGARLRGLAERRLGHPRR